MKYSRGGLALDLASRSGFLALLRRDNAVKPRRIIRLKKGASSPRRSLGPPRAKPTKRAVLNEIEPSRAGWLAEG
jgi:hypothetical protein